jgi:hypothetical protein
MKKKYGDYYIFKVWKKHQFKIIVIMSIILILFLYFNNDVKDGGTWSLEYAYIPEKKNVRYVRESKGEKECRRVMETLFKRPFPNQRPKFLMNTVTGKPLEIDCCNMDLKLGVEYNGKQHYEYVKGMHKNFESFRIQQYRDEMKKKRCEDKGFHLISVSYRIPINSIENYLIEELRKLGYSI